MKIMILSNNILYQIVKITILFLLIYSKYNIFKNYILNYCKVKLRLGNIIFFLIVMVEQVGCNMSLYVGHSFIAMS